MLGGYVFGKVGSDIAPDDVFLLILNAFPHNLLIVVIDHGGHLVGDAPADEVGYRFDPRRTHLFFTLFVLKD